MDTMATSSRTVSSFMFLPASITDKYRVLKSLKAVSCSPPIISLLVAIHVNLTISDARKNKNGFKSCYLFLSFLFNKLIVIRT